ncbi:hypothetical protein OGAPHI_004439 [Ogataea philodendri]|uniref:Uncharacterized protein n=1 Tax=Ogataea philodendri TaxID=1378263 RepID=A0A9P8P743_9ASCO|nr:uncharacterized protein OGAPHI_004439 [Ogataea philodendri]KAH3666250.1 hypothetical protein OGAPHI_004439 [Ogataea philodendri]
MRFLDEEYDFLPAYRYISRTTSRNLAEEVEGEEGSAEPASCTAAEAAGGTGSRLAEEIVVAWRSAGTGLEFGTVAGQSSVADDTVGEVFGRGPG